MYFVDCGPFIGFSGFRMMTSLLTCFWDCLQMYSATSDFTGTADLTNTVQPATANETDGDQYVARALRASLEPLFAAANVKPLTFKCQLTMRH